MAVGHREMTERAETFFAAYNRRDWDECFAEVDPEVEWDPVEENVRYRGRAAIVEYFERWLAVWSEFRVELEEIEFTPSEDRQFSAMRYVAKVPASDTEVEGHFFSVIEMRDGRWWRGKEFIDRTEARAAFEGNG